MVPGERKSLPEPAIYVAKGKQCHWRAIDQGWGVTYMHRESFYRLNGRKEELLYDTLTLS